MRAVSVGRLASPCSTRANRIEAEHDLSCTREERDRFEEAGTRLANVVGEFLGVDVAEWSSANDPILARIEALEARAASASQAGAE